MPASHEALDLRDFHGQVERHTPKDVQRSRQRIGFDYEAIVRAKALIARVRA